MQMGPNFDELERAKVALGKIDRYLGQNLLDQVILVKLEVIDLINRYERRVIEQRNNY
jgi:hypothetical protein